MRNSIRIRLLVTYIGMAVIPIVIVGAIFIDGTNRFGRQQALDFQDEVAQRVAIQVQDFIQEVENDLRLLLDVQGLERLNPSQQEDALGQLLALKDVFETISLLDETGQEQIRVARVEIVSNLVDRSDSDAYLTPKTQGEVYYGPVEFDELSGEPLMTIALPVINLRSGEVSQVLVADFRLRTLWDLVGELQAAEDQEVFVTDNQDRIIAHGDHIVVLQGQQFVAPADSTFMNGREGVPSVIAVERINFGDQEFNVVVERPTSTALAQVGTVTTIVILSTLFFLVAATLLGYFVVQRMVTPIKTLATAAEAIQAGDLSQKVTVQNQDEIGILANAFNAMVNQLRQTIDTLELRVVNRTKGLTSVSNINEQLTTILNLDDLISEVINQVEQNFGYYHAHIYLLDEAGENLVMVEGMGAAGDEMKARGHHIPLNTTASLVARAARSGESVWVDNVRQTVDWLPNPLLPDTFAEMAVPIALDGEVVGVLDVQENEIAAFDEGDASLLKSLANQIAIAIRNARLFEQVEQSLAEIELAQERYREESWQKINVARKTRGAYLYNNSPTALDVEEQQRLSLLQQRALMAEEPTLLTMDEGELQTNNVVSPLKLGQTKIGSLQLHGIDRGNLSGDDLAILNAVVDQFAQTAENLRLFDETRQRVSQEQTLREITEKMRAATSLDQLAQVTAEALGEHLATDIALVNLGRENLGHKQPQPNGQTHQNGRADHQDSEA